MYKIVLNKNKMKMKKVKTSWMDFSSKKKPIEKCLICFNEGTLKELTKQYKHVM